MRGIADAVGDLLGAVDIVHTAAARRGLRRRRGVGRPRRRRARLATCHLVLRGTAPLRRLALSRRRGAEGSGAGAPNPAVALPAPAASGAPARVARAVVADGLRGRRRARRLPGRGERRRPHGRVRSHHRRAQRQHARGVPGDGARRPAQGAVDLRRDGRSPPTGLALVYMSRVPRGAEPGGAGRVQGPARARRRSAGHRHRRRRACACGARARSAWRPTGRRGRRLQSATVSRPARSHRLEHCRQRLRRPTSTTPGRCRCRRRGAG